MPRARIHLDVRLLSRARLEFRDKKRRGLGSDAVRNEHAEQLARPMVGDVEPLPFTVSRGQCDRECEGPRRICSTRRRRANRSLSGGHARDRRGIGRARRPLDRSPRPCARLLFATRFGILGILRSRSAPSLSSRGHVQGLRVVVRGARRAVRQNLQSRVALRTTRMEWNLTPPSSSSSTPACGSTALPPGPHRGDLRRLGGALAPESPRTPRPYVAACMA